MESLQTLKVNPILKPRHLQYYFQVSQPTASRYMKILRDSIGKKLLTFMDFFNEYSAFPEPRFKPSWVSIERPKRCK